MILRILAGLLALFLLDAAVFRTRLYTPWLEPDSSAGLFELILRRELEFQRKAGDNVVVTLGDSRFGYLPKAANRLAPASGLVFRTAGVAGTDARSWYYLLRDLDPTASRYRAIVFGVNDYDDEDMPLGHQNDLRSLHYTPVRLRLSDTLGFAASYDTWQQRWHVLRGSLLKGFVYQHDLQAFFSAPRRRIEYVRKCRSGFEGWTYDYEGPEATMTGLEIDWHTLTARFPASMDDNQRSTVTDFLLYKPLPQTGIEARFRRTWYGRILDRYRGSRTRMIFLRLPRGPLVRPELVRKRSATIRELGRRPGVVLIDEDAFDPLERPELFQDGLHLNRPGSIRFSRMMVDSIAAALKGAR